MATHRPSNGPHHNLETYLRGLQMILDDYKSGEIPESTAISRHSDLAVWFQGQLTEAFVVRLRTTQAFRTPRGQALDEKVDR